MKIKLLFGLLIVIGLTQCGQSQDNQFYKWQFQAKVGALIPIASADLFLVTPEVDFETQVFPSFDLSYYFSKHISAELIFSISKHNVDINIPFVGKINVGNIWLYPLNINGQYHFKLNNFDPYLGAGINWTHFDIAEIGSQVESAVFDAVFGLAFQSGVNYYVSDRWSVNIDAKKFFLSTDVGLDVPTISTTPLDISLKIDPWLFGAGVGFHF